MDAPSPRPAPSLPGALLFSSRAAFSAVLAYLVYQRFLPLPGAIWAAVSALLVSQPALHPSMRASLARCLANLIGAGFGALAVAALGPGHPLVALVLAVVATGTTCHLSRLDDALRPAYVATAIVVLTVNGATASVWTASGDRLIAVAVGCAVSIGVALTFDLALGGLRRQVAPRQGETE